MSILLLSSGNESEWKSYSSPLSNEKMLAFQYKFSFRDVNKFLIKILIQLDYESQTVQILTAELDLRLSRVSKLAHHWGKQINSLHAVSMPKNLTTYSASGNIQCMTLHVIVVRWMLTAFSFFLSLFFL